MTCAVLRGAHRAQAQQARRRHRHRSTTPPSRRASTSARSRARRRRRDRHDRVGRVRRPCPHAPRAPPTTRSVRLRRRLIVAVALGLPGAPAVDDPGPPVRRLAMGRARARHAGRDLGGLAVPPGDGAQPAPPPGDDGHPDLDRRDRRLRLVAVGAAVHRRRRDRRRRCRWPGRVGSGDTPEIYLEVASAVVAFILAGRYFEARAKRRAGDAIRALLDLGAKDVAVLDEHGTERRVPIAELARRRSVRRAPGREGRNRRCRRRGRLGDRPLAGHRRERAGRGRRPATR